MALTPRDHLQLYDAIASRDRGEILTQLVVALRTPQTTAQTMLFLTGIVSAAIRTSHPLPPGVDMYSFTSGAFPVPLVVEEGTPEHAATQIAIVGANEDVAMLEALVQAAITRGPQWATQIVGFLVQASYWFLNGVELADEVGGQK